MKLERFGSLILSDILIAWIGSLGNRRWRKERRLKLVRAIIRYDSIGTKSCHTRLARGHSRDCSCRFKASIKCSLIRRGRLLARHCQPRRHSRARRGRAFTRVIFREYYATTFLLGPLGSPAKECGEWRVGELLVTSGMLVIDSSCDRHRNRSSERAMRDLSRAFQYKWT